MKRFLLITGIVALTAVGSATAITIHDDYFNRPLATINQVQGQKFNGYRNGTDFMQHTALVPVFQNANYQVQPQ